MKRGIHTFGDLPGISEGNDFSDRQSLHDANIHRGLQGGISGNPKDGASSIVLSGGYVDDKDLGDEIIYTGHGGHNPNSNRQIADQS
tara:strand:- start:238 stop:498 length:261 start_codon:yes stop_codon:yes gene_type:complete